MAIVLHGLGDVGPKLAPADPYAAARAAAQAAGAAAARASSSMGLARLKTLPATASALPLGAKIAIAGGVAGVLILIASRRL